MTKDQVAKIVQAAAKQLNLPEIEVAKTWLVWMEATEHMTDEERQKFLAFASHFKGMTTNYVQ